LSQSPFCTPIRGSVSAPIDIAGSQRPEGLGSVEKPQTRRCGLKLVDVAQARGRHGARGEVAFLDHLKVVAAHSCSFSSSQSISTETSAAFLGFQRLERSLARPVRLSGLEQKSHRGRAFDDGILGRLLAYDLTLHLFTGLPLRLATVVFLRLARPFARPVRD
jgi:hypothetical protein